MTHPPPDAHHAQRTLSAFSGGWLPVAGLLLLLLLLPRAAGAAPATVPEGYAVQTLAVGLDRPARLAVSPDGRVFIAQQNGAVRVLHDGTLLPQPFVTVATLTGGERGLAGIALDPGFPAVPHVYLYYTAAGAPPRNRVSRFTVRGDAAVAGSEQVIAELDPLGAPEYHNGGAIRFGPDGMLYIATGDAGAAANAQRLDSRHGKLLRLRPDGGIPPDNPFFSTATGANRAIWALGLRNPFSFAFGVNGRMLINDVGNAAWEEINEGAAGANYGWPVVEGPSNDPRFRAPLLAYPHQGGTFHGCAITGAAPHRFPGDPPAAYYFADFCQGWLRRLDPATGQTAAFAAELGTYPVDLAPAPDGGLYVLLYGETGQGPRGLLRRIWHTGSPAPVISDPPAPLTVPVGGAAQFTTEAYGAAPLAYRWQRNGADIPGATGPGYQLPAVTLADDGARFRVVVSNAAGSAVSAEARLTVTRNGVPTVQITAPAAGTRYRAGERITWSATASDPDDGPLPPSAFTVWVDFHHDTHSHPFITATPGASSGAFTIPDEGEPSATVWYQLTVSARDSAGVTATSSVDLHPRTASLTLASVPAGLLLSLDGQPVRAPLTVTSVVGMRRSIGAVTPQAHAGTSYRYRSWSDGGAATHTITTADAGGSYTVSYEPAAATIPNTPDGLEAAATGPSGNRIRWRDHAADEDRQQVVWSRSSPIGWHTVDLAADLTEWLHTPVTTDRSYFYFVRACNAAGCSDWSPGLRVDYTPPAMPEALRVETVTSSSITLRWENTPVNEQSIEVAWTAAAPVAYRIVELAPDATSTALTGLTPGTRYWAHVRACNPLGCSAWSAGIEGTTDGGAAPAQPENVRAGTVTDTSIELRWDGPVAGATALQAAWTPADAIAYQFAGIAPQATAWTLTGATAGRTYYLHLRACNAASCSPWTGALTITTPGGACPSGGPPPGRQPPMPPDDAPLPVLPGGLRSERPPAPPSPPAGSPAPRRPRTPPPPR